MNATVLESGSESAYASTGSVKGLLIISVFALAGILLLYAAYRRLCRHHHETTHARYTGPRR